MAESTTKWQAQANGYLQEVLNLLQLYEGVGFIGQKPYKDDFFRVFSAAFRTGFCLPHFRVDPRTGVHHYFKCQRPLVDGETIWSYARSQGWVHAKMNGNEKRYRDIDMVRTWWDEWIYAWQRNPPPRRYQRKI